MKSFLKAITAMFSKYDPENDILNTPLQKYKGKIEINKVVEVGNCRVHYSLDYAFETPVEILNRIKDKSLLWIDSQNGLLGCSDQKKTLLIPLHKIKGMEIQNILKGKGPGESDLMVCLYGSKFIILSISPDTFNFDKYVEEIQQTIGFTVTFSEEFYNT